MTCEMRKGPTNRGASFLDGTLRFRSSAREPHSLAGLVVRRRSPSVVGCSFHPISLSDEHLPCGCPDAAAE